MPKSQLCLKSCKCLCIDQWSRLEEDGGHSIGDSSDRLSRFTIAIDIVVGNTFRCQAVQNSPSRIPAGDTGGEGTTAEASVGPRQVVGLATGLGAYSSDPIDVADLEVVEAVVQVDGRIGADHQEIVGPACLRRHGALSPSWDSLVGAASRSGRRELPRR